MTFISTAPRTALRRSQRGLTLIEVLLAIAIFAILAGVSFAIYVYAPSSQSLQATTAELTQTLRRAQAQSLNGEADTNSGVHLESGQYVLFQGGTYGASAATNEFFVLPVSTSISGWSLVGGGNDIIFDRLLGTTATDGSITIVSNEGSSRTITVNAAGLVDM